ncbi:hypothetical protein ABWL39_06245 [Chitinivorax sp. PXF-14]|uniref:hypothetical protein n=1 Tax=Chitinivorax sp. PXF-14 TaxID=3230488 RepID=UPI003466D677
MKKILAIGLSALLLAACSTVTKIDKSYYTHVGFWHEDNVSKSGNYRRGEFVPVNTQVRLIEVADSKKGTSFTLELPEHTKPVTVETRREYTKGPAEDIQAKLFGDKPVALSPAYANDIKAGRIVVGMSKADVLAAIGYPPEHKTPSLDDEQWTFWISRFDKQLIVFDKGRVKQIID